MKRKDFNYLEFKPSKGKFVYWDKKTEREFIISPGSITPFKVIGVALFRKDYSNSTDMKKIFSVTSEYYISPDFKNKPIIRTYEDKNLVSMSVIEHPIKYFIDTNKVKATIYGVYNNKNIAIILPIYNIKNIDIHRGDIINIAVKKVFSEFGDFSYYEAIPEKSGEFTPDKREVTEFDNSVKEYFDNLNKELKQYENRKNLFI